MAEMTRQAVADGLYETAEEDYLQLYGRSVLSPNDGHVPDAAVARAGAPRFVSLVPVRGCSG